MKKELTLQDLRIMGGKAILKKYGKKYFSMLGKKSAEKRRLLKEKQKLV